MSYSPFPPAFAAPGAGTPTDALLQGGSDGTDIRALLVDTTGRLMTQRPNNALFGTTAISVTTTAHSISSTAAANGACVVVTVGNIAASAQFAGNVSVRVRNTTTGVHTGWQSAGLLFVGQEATQYHNLPVTGGDTVVVDTIAPTTITASKTTIAAVLSPLTTPSTMRSDGRGMPLGSQAVQANPTNAIQTPIGAPGAGFRILVATMQLNPQGSVLGQIQGTVNGSAVPLTGAAQASLFVVIPATQGILLDPNTAVTVQSFSTSQVNAFITYDIVPL